ncbi:MAG: hemerythrin family protein [Zoogloeaceae bacterium]|nr:hemerythrin family protein [Rhodocyclaceae bacterium]MCP5235290.1 hemerythrin family protein [Zoogloeaceae bacterium]
MPKPIRWNDAMLTGIEEIDRQHRVLVSTLNEVIAHLPDGASDELAERITRDLLSYTLYHFDAEQGLMHSYGYIDACGDDAARHLAQHQAFSERVEALRDQINRGEILDLTQVVRFLQKWLVGHIMNTDLRFGEFVRSGRSGVAGSR